ncbi:cytochrome P450 [Pleomassaria siparia CBS 279.74]|uniref:Cytochrome P450 n=1 Tax=Pleomassaria siparia CBS 279.74 TaxID=1314801 RepID=A0A6G1KKG1_9PLEO|nr:cytochrome P450 [Pleomassaria siparia CBS 279.74]
MRISSVLDQWSDEYGPIYGINIFGNNHIWLSDDNIANELLSKRGALHQDRPSLHQLEDSQNAPEYLPLLGYNEAWRRQRKLVTQVMAESVRTRHHNIPYLELPQMLSELLSSPEDYQDHLENYTSRVICRLSYGDAEHFAQIRAGSHGLIQAISPAKHITNIIPQLKWLPMWMSPWKKEEARRHADERVFFLHTVAVLVDQMSAGTARWSYLQQCLENKTEAGISDMECSYIVGMIGLAGVLTTSTAMMTYLLAMSLYPEWQTRLQNEVDTVCGDRMPELSDAPQMPLLRAVVMEIMRWRPIVPSDIPHQTTEDDVYDGYFIPKGSYIHPSPWAITRDTSMFPEPELFNPDRWLSPEYPSYKEPLTEFPSIRNFTSFGYGRRICMGMNLTENEFFLAMGGMAWAMTISKKKDVDGREISIPHHDYSQYLISRPENFNFQVKPRSEKRGIQVEDHRRAAKALLDAPLKAERQEVSEKLVRVA